MRCSLASLHRTALTGTADTRCHNARATALALLALQQTAYRKPP